MDMRGWTSEGLSGVVERMNVVQQGHPWTCTGRCVSRIWR